MNNREKRQMEKKLGLLKVKSKLRLEHWIEEVQQNIQSGKRKQEEMKEIRRMQENKAEEKAQSEQIASIATDLMFNKKMPFAQAQEEAKRLYKESIKT